MQFSTDIGPKCGENGPISGRRTKLGILSRLLLSWFFRSRPVGALSQVRKVAERSFPNFSNFRSEFCPEFCSEFSPNFSKTFRASFRGRRRPEKMHQKSPPFFNAKFPGKHKKIFTKFFWRAGKVTLSHCPPKSHLCPLDFSPSKICLSIHELGVQ